MADPPEADEHDRKKDEACRFPYAALVDRDALAAWLPPQGMTARFERFDPRPGGSYRLILTYTDASGAPGKATPDADILEARYVDIVSDARVVQAVDFVSDDATGLASSLANLAGYIER
jgi:uncharacterized protein YndB with AHSA1/START domain